MKVNFNRIIIPSSRDDMLNLLTKFIQCKICMNILNDPYDCLCCNQTFCKSCILNYIKTNNKCPFSEFFGLNNPKDSSQNKKINNNDLLSKIKPSSSNFAKFIQSLKFQCQNCEKGCNAELSVEGISEHEKICKFKGKKIKVELNKKNKLIVKNKDNHMNKNEKEKEKENLKLYEDFNSYDSNNDVLQDDLSNQLKHQDSVVSFSGMKNFSENRNITQFNISENENTNINILNNSKIEKSIEEINQKLSYINSFIVNHYDYKTHEKKKSFKDIDNDIEKEVSDFSQNQNDDLIKSKIYKRNSVEVPNKFKDDSRPNTLYNFTNDNTSNNSEFNTINNYLNKNNEKNTDKSKINKTNKKEENKDRKNQLYKSLQSKTITAHYLLNEKDNKNKKFHKNKKIINKKNSTNINMTTTTESKKADLLDDKKNKEKQENKNKPKDLNSQSKINNSNNNNNNNNENENSEVNITPKLGSKTQQYIKDVKSFDLNMNLNLNTEKNNNSLFAKSEEYSPNTLNEDIFNGIKNLNSKITGIERLLQSNNSFKNQAYSIQNEDLFGDIQINPSQNEDSITKGTISIKSSIKEIQNLTKNENQKNLNDKEKESNNKSENIKNDNKNDDKNNKNEEKSDKKEIADNTNSDEAKESEKKSIDENSMKKLEELITKIENEIKDLVNEKFDGFKKYMEEQYMEDMKKCVFDTNFDIMTLCTDRLDEFSKLLNDKINNIKL